MSRIEHNQACSIEGTTDRRVIFQKINALVEGVGVGVGVGVSVNLYSYVPRHDRSNEVTVEGC